MGFLSRKRDDAQDSKRSVLFGGRNMNKDGLAKRTLAATVPNRSYSQRAGGYGAQGQSHSAQPSYENDSCSGTPTPGQQVGRYSEFKRTTSQETMTVNADCNELFGSAAQRQQVSEPQQSVVYGHSGAYGDINQNGGYRQPFGVYELGHDVAEIEDEIRLVKEEDDKTLGNAMTYGFTAVEAGRNILANLDRQDSHLRGYVIPDLVSNFGSVANIRTVLKNN
jgi:hypothetical protein